MKKLLRWLSITSLMWLTACGGGDSNWGFSNWNWGSDASQPGPAAEEAIGKIHLSGPLVGASVRVVDANGKEISSASRPTDAGGIFHISIPESDSSRFRVIATGGTHQGEPFTDTLALDVENFSIADDVLYANAATTLISKHLDRNPTIGVEKANQQVKNFLRIPATSSAGFDVANPKQTYFSHNVLLSAVSESGASSLSAYLNGVMDEMAAGVPSHAFAKAPTASAKALKMSSFIGFLTHALADDGVSLAFEHATTLAGIDGTAEILEQLHEINAKLDNLTELTYDLLSGQKDELLQNITLALAKDVSFIQGQYKHLTTVAQAASSHCTADDRATRQECENFRQLDLNSRQKKIESYVDAILNETTGVEVRLAQIASLHLAMAGTELGLIARADNFLRTTRPFDAPIDDPRLLELHGYYQSIQEMGVHLVIEAYNYRARGPSHAVEQNSKPQSVDNGGKVALYLYLDHSLPQQLARIEEVRYKNEEVVEQLRTDLVWLRAPVTNLPYGLHSSYDNFHGLAEKVCEQKASQHFGGYANWRLPSESELHAVVKGDDSPNNSGNADGGTGLFEWFVKKGFKQANHTFDHYSEGFWVGQPAVAYFSNTRSGDSYFEAIWDYGVDSASIHPNTSSQPRQYYAKTGGAWCVANKGSEH